jgi:hypothetical protein
MTEDLDGQTLLSNAPNGPHPVQTAADCPPAADPDSAGAPPDPASAARPCDAAPQAEMPR